MTNTPGHLSMTELLRRWRSELTQLNFPDGELHGATETEIVQLEQRIGRPLPASYREFLTVSNGMAGMGGFMSGLRPANSVGWFRDVEQQWYDIWRDIDGSDEPEGDVALMARALIVSEPGDQALLLDPDEVDPETGEWACLTFSNWAPGSDPAGSSFRAGLDRAYLDFLSNDPIQSETCDEIEAFVEDRYQAMLAGDVHAFDQFDPYVRNSWRITLLTSQSTAFVKIPRGHNGLSIPYLWRGIAAVSPDEALADPVLINELIPYYVVRLVEGGRDFSYDINREEPAVGDRLRAVLSAIESGVGPVADFSYSPEFAVAVEQARTEIAADHLDAAWQIVEAALPSWTPMSGNHVAPMGLYWDKDLRRLFELPPPPPPAPVEYPPGTIVTTVIAGFSNRPTPEPVPSTASIVADPSRKVDQDRLRTVLATPYSP